MGVFWGLGKVVFFPHPSAAEWLVKIKIALAHQPVSYQQPRPEKPRQVTVIIEFPDEEAALA